MATAAPSGSSLPWRVAAVLVLLGGFGAALWIDPALLDGDALRFSLAGVFAVLWMVPVLRAKSAARRALRADPVDWHDTDPKSGRAWIDTGFGLIVGVLLGALALAVPGTGLLLSSGPDLTERLFGWAAGWGPWASSGAMLVAVAAVSLLFGLTRYGIRASRIVGGLVLGLWLWVPFHAGFAAGFARLGIDLPGLQTAPGGN